MTSTASDDRPDATSPAPGRVKVRGTGPFYFAALICSGLSLDTAARFFSQRMHIAGPIHGFPAELAALCIVGELALVACGYAMRHNVRASGRPGAAQLVALALCSAEAFMAFALGGLTAGFVRAFFGPVLALTTLHLALGIEVRVHRVAGTGAWARIWGEVRERFLSRFGLGNDQRDAAQRSRDRARARAARLAVTPDRWWVVARKSRLARAVRAAGADVDPEQRSALVGQTSALRHLDDLISSDAVSPWLDVVPPHVQALIDQVGEQRAAAEQHAEQLRHAAQADVERLLAEARREASVLVSATSDAARLESERIIATARDEARRLLADARRDVAALLATTTSTPARPMPAAARPSSTVKPTDASIEQLADALDEQFPDTIPGRPTAQPFLRDLFGGCSAARADAAIGQLRARRNGHREAPEERLQLTGRINGNHPTGVLS